MSQSCSMSMDIVPFSLTSEVVLPSYQHFLEREHHLKGTQVNESEALIQFDKTILMLILARVNGYYSPYTAQTIKEEEDRCYFGRVFTHAEQEFFKHKLQAKYPKINQRSLDTAITFLRKQKLANCPCQVHTKTRGYDWVVFRRQPDRTPTLYYEQTESESEEDTEDEVQEQYDEEEDYFSMEQENEDNQENQDAIGAASPESSGKSADESNKKTESEDQTSIHSREKEKNDEERKSKKKSLDEDMESQDSDDTDVQQDTTRRRNNFICFKPLMYYNRQLDRYYYFKYFKPYKYDHRLLTMGHDCACQPRRLHKSSCSWYDSDNIFIIDSHADLSISEKTAQQKIYKIYMETLNNLPDECGCGTQASVYYMGHSTSCDDFKHVHERESHEVLLAILNKKKKLSFDAEFDPRHQNYESQVAVEAELADLADFEQVVPIPDTKETTPELNNSSPQVMSKVAKNVTSVTKPPNNPPNASSITDIPVMSEEKPVDKPEDEEMPPLVDITEDITG